MNNRWCATLVVVFLTANGVFADFSEQAKAQYQVQHDALIMNQTQGGYIYSRHSNGEQFSSLNYDINLGLNFNLVNFDFSGTEGHDLAGLGPWTGDLAQSQDQNWLAYQVLGISADFLSSFDFRMGQLYSDPVLVKYQNPQAEVYLEGIGPAGTVLTHLGGGVAHESNGAFLVNQSDYLAARQIGNGTLANQTLASMGWNFYFVRYGFNLLNLVPVPITLFGEVRYHTNQWGVEDRTDFGTGQISPGGIVDYDGLRTGLVYYFDEKQFFRFLVVKGLSNNDHWGADAALALSYKSMNMTFGVRSGTMTSPAWYYDNTFVFTAGIRIPTTFYGTDVIRNVFR